MSSAPFHPASNGLVERAVQTIKAGMTKTAGCNMDVKLQSFLFGYRRTPQSTMGLSPMEVLNRRKMRSRLDLLQPAKEGTEKAVTHERLT